MSEGLNFAAAREEHDRLAAELRGKSAERDRLYRLIAAASVETIPERSAHLFSDEDRKRIQEIRRRPARWIERYDDLGDEIAALQPKVAAARQQFDAAAAKETDRIALTLQPRQKAAVRKIAAALEALSVAIAEERAVRAELVEKAPRPTSRHLPDLSSGLGLGALSDSHSRASTWARTMREMKVL